jgi:PAS domain S-box-containing protein
MLRYLNTIGFCFSILLLLVIGAAVYRNTQGLIKSARRVAHTQEVLTQLVNVLSAVYDLEAGSRGYALTGDISYLDPLFTSMGSVMQDEQRLRDLTSDNASQQERLNVLESLVTQRIAAARKTVSSRNEGGLTAAAEVVATGEGKSLTETISTTIRAMTQEEQRLLAQRRVEEEASTAATLRWMGIGLILVMCVLVGVYLLLRREISHRRRNELALERSEEENRLLVQNLSAGVMVHGPDTRVLLCNQQALEMLGLSADQVLGKTTGELGCTFVHEDGTPLAEEEYPVTRVLATREPFQCQIIGAERAGIRGRVWMLVSAFADLVAHRRHMQVVVTLVDITAYLEARKDRDRIFTQSIDMLVVSSFDGFFKEFSPSVKQTLGWTPEEMLEKPFLDYVHPDDRESTLQAVSDQSTGQTVHGFDNRYLCKDGTYKWISWNSFPSVDEQLMFAIARDVTDKKKAETEIKELNASLERRARELEAANKELEAFSYSVSHDLRAPLRHINGFLELLQKSAGGALREDAQRFLGIIKDSAKQMGVLIDDLLAFSRIGRAPLNAGPVPLGAVVAEVISDLAHEASGRDVKWIVKDLPQVQGDRNLLKLAIANLLDNALKYTRPRETAVIEVRSEKRDETVVIQVRDNGVGFDPRGAEKLFGVFQRLHSTSEFEGTGIGLANVRRIVSRHGGETWAESEPGTGSTFFFSLPEKGMATT